MTAQFRASSTQLGGKVAKTEYWGVKSLNYRIRKNRKAHITLLNVEAAPAALNEVERQERINEDVLRDLTMRVEELEEGPSAMMRKVRPRPDRGERRGDRGDRDARRLRDRPRREDAIRRRSRSGKRGGIDHELSHGASGGGARRPFFRRRKTCPFSGANAPKIDYKDVELLQRYISERGKIVPSRITAVSRQKAARIGAGDQARAFSRPAALRDQVTQRNNEVCGEPRGPMVGTE